jgi:transcriptional regulator
MYIPRHFEVTDREEIFSFVEANGFGQLISQVEGRPFCTHLPLVLSEDRSRLLAHIARVNPQHLEIEGQEALVILEGPHDYISPSWYTGAGVPTWNYQAVHIYGVCRVFNEPARLQELVGQLTAKYEAGFEKPWQPEYKEAMLGAIVGLDIEIRDVQCKYKLSQNRPAADQEQVVQALREGGSEDLAQAMEKNIARH